MDHAHDGALIVAAGVIAASPFMAAAMSRWPGWIFVRPWPLAPAAVVVRHAIAILSLGAGAIHVSAIADHFGGGLVAGTLFSAAAWFQLLWPVLYLTTRRPGHESIAAVVNLAIIGAWIVSRTVGLPAPIGEGHVEPVGALDALATIFAAGVVVGANALVAGGERLERRLVLARSASLALLGLVAIVTILSTVAIGAGLGHSH